MHDFYFISFKAIDNEFSFQFNAFYDNFKFDHIDNYEHDLRKNSIPQLYVLPPFFSRFDDPVNYAFRSEPVKKELEKLKKTIMNTSHEKDPNKSEVSDGDSENDGEQNKITGINS